MLHSFYCFFNDTATTEIYTLSLHDALPISRSLNANGAEGNEFDKNRSHAQFLLPIITRAMPPISAICFRSEEHTSELQSLRHLVCRLLLEKKKNNNEAKMLSIKRDSVLDIT